VNVSVAFYNVDGTRKFANEAKDLEVAPYSSLAALSVARISDLSSTYFVRCRMNAADGTVLADNTYWESTTDDDLGSPKNDVQFTTKLVKWADLSALDTMPRSEVTASTKFVEEKGEGTARITLTNRSNHVAFFLRAEITKGADGEEVLPITYEDNYITLYPHETRSLLAKFAISALDGHPAALRVEGYNVARKIVPPNQ
jgi:exo-1,4-beta-D-glucosaminidase